MDSAAKRMMKDSEDQKLQVQQATDVVRLIGEHVALRAKGREYVGLCPFHDDSNPSMQVSPAKQIYKCFSCGAGGDVFSFVMNYHKVGFVEALKILAERAGIRLTRRGQTQPQGESPRERIAEANQLAVAYFRARFNDPQLGATAQRYTQDRGITPEMIEAFAIGYAPDGWDGLIRELSGKFDDDGLIQAGLATKRSGGNGGCYDRFRHRLIFPIFDALGRPIAFGGRRLREEDEPKYLNSPETPVFNKSATLYGLHLAKKAIVDQQTVVVVEGYTDVVACHQAGVKNVVATLGTSLTAEHVRVLSRLCEKVVLVFDADAAGEKAADRAAELFLAGQLDIAVAVLPAGSDPAELLRKAEGLAVWQRVIDGAADALDYKFDQVRRLLGETDTLAGRHALAEEFVGRLGSLGLSQWLGRTGWTGRALMVQRLGDLLRMNTRGVEALLKQSSPSRRPAVTERSYDERVPVEENPEPGVVLADLPHTIKAIQVAERQLIGCLLHQPGLFHRALPDGACLDESVTPSDVTHTETQRLYTLLYEHLVEGREVTLGGVLAELASRDEQDLASLATGAESQVDEETVDRPDKLETMFETAVAQIVSTRTQRAYQHTRQQAIDSTDSDVTRQDQIFKEVLEHQRANPSPVRIAR